MTSSARSTSPGSTSASTSATSVRSVTSARPTVSLPVAARSGSSPTMPEPPWPPGAEPLPDRPAAFRASPRPPEFLLRRRDLAALSRSGDSGASCPGSVPFVSTSVTARSARLAGSAGPERGEACPRPPWPSGPGCLRAAERAALPTAVTPSFAGRRPAEPRTTP